MDKNSFLKKILNPKIKDYSYAVAFFLIFAFFTYFVIRPNLLSIFKSLNKITELRTTNAFYDIQVKKIIDLQTNLESARDDLHYLDEAMPVYPQVNKVFGDIRNLAEKNSLLIERINFDNINLKDNKTAKAAKNFKLEFKASGSFESTRSFLKDLHDQLRLKTISEMNLVKENTASSESSQLKIELIVNSYYL